MEFDKNNWNSMDTRTSLSFSRDHDWWGPIGDSNHGISRHGFGLVYMKYMIAGRGKVDGK